ncbi:hypothetical protein HLRTI_002692 [Halorhabdus tiamatea SARL4B]|uniref:Uncharacterized protein n=1 Tax=Halorhabdus tiamatea SARL4B TaxID=1033806 RepID=U2DYR4_9EURY|nr:hypothetical protein HLRTI_002692 [Halorhabdus tiamatea SARL4B]
MFDVECGLQGVARRVTRREQAVVLHEQALELPLARVFGELLADGFGPWRDVLGDGDRLAEGVGEFGDVDGELPPGGGEGGRVRRVGVDDPTEFVVRPVDVEVCARIDRGLEVAFDDRAVHVHDDEVLRGEFVVIDAAGFDHDAIALATADVAAGTSDEVVLGECHQRLVDRLA